MKKKIYLKFFHTKKQNPWNSFLFFLFANYDERRGGYDYLKKCNFFVEKQGKLKTESVVGTCNQKITPGINTALIESENRIHMLIAERIK